MWDRIGVVGRVAWSILGVGAVVALVLWVSLRVQVVFPPLVFAGAIVFLLNPVVTGLQRRGVPRIVGTAGSYLGFFASLVAIGFLLTPLVTTQADELSEQWPELRADMEDWLNDLSDRSKENNWIVEVPNVDELWDQLGGGQSEAASDEFDRVIQDAAAVLESNGRPVLAADLDRVAADTRSQIPEEGGILEKLATVREIGTRIFEIGLIFLLGPIIAFYLLVDLPHIGKVAEELVPARAKREVLHVAHRLNMTIGGFFRGQLVVAVIVGIMVSTGLGILGLPFWLIVGMIAGLFNLVPLIGPWVGAVPGVIIALTTSDVSTALWVVAVMAGAQQVDNHFISPLVMQRTVSLHPAAVMLALLAGGSLAGFFGLLLAVPVVAALKVVCGHLWAVYVLQTPLDTVLARAAEPVDVDDGLLEPLDDYVNNHLGEGGSHPEPEPEGAKTPVADAVESTGEVSDTVPEPGGR